MKYISRILCILCGTVFLLSGLGKLLNVFAFQQLIVRYGLAPFQFLAPFIILTEIFLGAVLVLGLWQRKSTLSALLLLVIFTGAYTYGYLKNDMTECGCFGNIIKSTPTSTYIRNLLLMAALTVVLFLNNEETNTLQPWQKKILWTIMLPSVFLSGMTYRLQTQKKHIHPWEGKNICETPLSRYAAEDSTPKIVFFMSYQCPHCWNCVENYLSYTEKNMVDTAYCYVVVNPIFEDKDSMQLRFKKNYPELPLTEVHIDSVTFLEGYPTSYYIENNVIQKVIQGELPSPLLFFNR